MNNQIKPLLPIYANLPLTPIVETMNASTTKRSSSPKDIEFKTLKIDGFITLCRWVIEIIKLSSSNLFSFWMTMKFQQRMMSHPTETPITNLIFLFFPSRFSVPRISGRLLCLWNGDLRHPISSCQQRLGSYPTLPKKICEG